MIQPTQSGAVLLEDIQTTQLAPGQVALWWLGQSGYAIKTYSTLLYVDLYLSEHLTAKYAHTTKPHIRMTEAPLHGTDITNADLVFASHKHSDHLDPETAPALFAASPNARLMLPAAITEHAVSIGLDRARLLPTRGSEAFTFGDLTVYTIPSAHPELDYTERDGYPFLGFVFQVDGVTLYHSGDTVVYDGLAETLRGFNPDIVFLPINGTDERRNELHVPPNMSMEDAVALAKTVNAKLLIPHHYDMFTFNTADVGAFERLAQAEGQPYEVLQAGEKFIWQAS